MLCGYSCDKREIPMYPWCCSIASSNTGKVKPLQAFDRSWGTRRMPAAAPHYALTTPGAVGMCSHYTKAQGLPQGPTSRGHPGLSLSLCHLGTDAGHQAVVSPGMPLPQPLCWVLWGAPPRGVAVQIPEPAQQLNIPLVWVLVSGWSCGGCCTRSSSHADSRGSKILQHRSQISQATPPPCFPWHSRRGARTSSTTPKMHLFPFWGPLQELELLH